MCLQFQNESSEVQDMDSNALVIEIITEVATGGELSLLESSEEFLTENTISLDLKEPPTANQLADFEKNPITALMALATNSGLGRFSATRNLYSSGMAPVYNISFRICRNLSNVVS